MFVVFSFQTQLPFSFETKHIMIPKCFILFRIIGSDKLENGCWDISANKYLIEKTMTVETKNGLWCIFSIQFCGRTKCKREFGMGIHFMNLNIQASLNSYSNNFSYFMIRNFITEMSDQFLHQFKLQKIKLLFYFHLNGVIMACIYDHALIIKISSS